MIATTAAPIIGAAQNNHNCCPYPSPESANNTDAVDRAGFTDVFVIGMPTRWINVSPSPIANGAKPFAARWSVAPRMISKKNPVSTASAMKHDTRLYPPGESGPKPFEAKPPATYPGLPDAIRCRMPAPIAPPMTCETIYGRRSLPGNRLPKYSPIDTAGFRWQPEICPMAYAMVSTVSPNASATPTKPMPTPG